MAIINSDALEEYKIQVPEIRRRIAYLLNLFPSELHIFVRPEIGSLQDLAGKKVNFNTQGTAAAYSGPLIFSRLGVNVDKTFIPHQIALEQMRKGEMAAVVFITSKPVDAFLRGRWDLGFKFVALLIVVPSATHRKRSRRQQRSRRQHKRRSGLLPRRSTTLFCR